MPEDNAVTAARAAAQDAEKAERAAYARLDEGSGARIEWTKALSALIQAGADFKAAVAAAANPAK